MNKSPDALPNRDLVVTPFFDFTFDHNLNCVMCTEEERLFPPFSSNFCLNCIILDASRHLIDSDTNWNSELKSGDGFRRHLTFWFFIQSIQTYLWNYTFPFSVWLVLPILKEDGNSPSSSSLPRLTLSSYVVLWCSKFQTPGYHLFNCNHAKNMS